MLEHIMILTFWQQIMNLYYSLRILYNLYHSYCTIIEDFNIQQNRGMLVNYTNENMLNKVKLISISTSTLSSMRTKFGHIWVLSGWAYIKNWVDTQRDCIAFRPSRMRDHRLACETIASRRVPSLSRDGLSRIRAIYISCQKLETYIARIFITVHMFHD